MAKCLRIQGRRKHSCKEVAKFKLGRNKTINDRMSANETSDLFGSRYILQLVLQTTDSVKQTCTECGRIARFILSQQIGNLQEYICIQTETVKNVDAERQQDKARANENMKETVSTNAKAIANLKAEREDAITKIEITLKQEQTEFDSALLDRQVVSGRVP